MARFYLRKPRKDGSCNIMLAICVNSQRLCYYTNIFAKPSEWDSQNQRIRNKARSLEVNTKLQQLSVIAAKFIDELPLDEKPTQCRFSEYMDIQLGRQKETKMSFFAFLEDFCSKGNQRINKRTGEFISEKTANRYNNTVNILKKFEIHQRRTNRYFLLSFDSFTPKVIADLKLYMTEVLEYAPATIGRHLKNVKLFLVTAGQKNIKCDIDLSLLRVREVKTENIILTEQEITRIYDLDLTDKPRLKNCRDMFLVQLFTGLRYSDVSRLNSSNVFAKEGKIRIHTQKTGTLVEIPIHPKISHIFEQEGFCHPITNAKYNLYLKELGQLAHIDTPVELKRIRAGKRELINKPKWKLMTSHTGRRTFCSLLFAKGVDSRLIMNFSGHSSATAFERYICLDNSQKNELLKKYW